MIACDNSIEMFDWAFEFISHAEQSIEFAPCYFGGELCQQILHAFEKQMEAHPKLQIYLMFEGTFLEEEDKILLTRLEKKYSRQFHTLLLGRVVHFDQEIMGISNHLKMLVVDESYYTFGGSNYDYVISSEGTHPEPKRIKPGVSVAKMLPSGSRDQDLAGRGAIAKKMRETFYKSYALWTDYKRAYRFTSKDPEAFATDNAYRELRKERPFITKFENAQEAVLVDSSNVSLIFGGPWRRPNRITEAYRTLIDNAKEEILIGNLYFSPAEVLINSLANASDRGLKLTVVTNGINDRAPPYTKNFSYANRVYFIPLLYGRNYTLWEKKKCEKAPLKSAAVYEYFVEDIVYHKKVMVVDRRYFVIGCYNLNKHSDFCDYELVMVIDSKELAQKAVKIFERDVEHSIKVTPETIKKWHFDPIVNYLSNLQRAAHTLI
ncbi:MAG: Cardiolipin synthase [Chlamydiales bacterium]|nr:Cardiolipin synthase [Chlamydiales bacterium]MCH9619974.1 Cardiolipin synthase [Chlamydiales bacterium]MCH9622599.1 Cardiolipin synthase [Chlamydiales bacterium]